MPLPVSTLVGRGQELDVLHAALERAGSGSGGVVLIAGEAGMGKSQIAEAIAADAARDGATVLWGRAWESGGAPPYWPWIEALRGLLAAGVEPPPGTAPVLARLLPELGPPADDDGIGPDEERFQLFDAVARLVEAGSRARSPIVLLLDDLHAADASSLLLLRFVAPRIRALPALLVGAYREVEALLAPDRAQIVNELARDAQVLRLSPLDEAAAAELVESVTGTPPARDVVRTLLDTTGGNPLFLAEAARLLASTGGSLPGRVPVPARLRDVIARRAAAFSEETAGALGAAAVVGRDFAVPLLARVLDTTDAELLYALDPAVVSGMVESGPSGRMRFSHVLVREALYDDLPPSQRTELHLAVAGAIETVSGDDAGEHLAEVAHHYLTAGRADAIDRGIDYAARAGDRAMRLLAFEQAAASFELAVAAAESHALPGGSTCELRLKLGDAYWRAGDASRARAAFAAAAEVASGGEDIARAAVGFGAIVVEAGGVDRELVALLERALATMPEDDHPLRAAVLGRFARELHFADQPDRRREMAEEAVAMARRLGDDAALARALGDWHRAEWRPDNLDQRLAATEEIAALANAQNDRETLFHALAWRFADFVERGDLFAADRELAACEGVAAGLRQPAWSWQTLVFRAGRALADGRYDAGERLAREALERGRSARGATASIYFTIHDLIRRRETGGLEEIEPVVRRLGEEQPSRWLSGHLWILAESGRLDEARERVEAAAASGYPSPTPDVTMVIRHAQMAHVVFALDDVSRAEVLYDRLLPYQDQWAPHGVGGGTQGSVHRHLGLLATTMGRYDEAERHFTLALEVHERSGTRTWVAHSLHAHALMLMRRGADGDEARASAMIDRAAEIARTLGMKVLLDSLEARAATPSAQPTLEREGEYWAIGWDGRTVRVRDSKGVRYLAALLAEPHTDVPARALVAGESDASQPTLAAIEADGLSVRDAGDDHAGDQLDPQARQEYRARARELEGELEEARALNDPERVEQVREELDFLAGELSRAVGLGGRPRQAGSTAERARLNATRAIRTAIRRIADQDEDLGRHLDDAVRTGNVCRYEPR